MLIKANIDIPETLSVFRTEGLQVSFIVPTETGLKKSMKTKRGREFNEMHQTNLLSDGGVILNCDLNLQICNFQ